MTKTKYSRYSFFSDSKIQSYDASLRDIKDFLVDELKILLLDSDILVKLTLLKEIPQFFVFLGRQLANDVLLSHIITYLNDSSWELRWYDTLLISSAFLETIVSISTSLGSKELEEYILPLIMMSIFGKSLKLTLDAEEIVIHHSLQSLISLAELRILSKQRIKSIFNVVAPLLSHPSVWIRKSKNFLCKIFRRFWLTVLYR